MPQLRRFCDLKVVDSAGACPAYLIFAVFAFLVVLLAAGGETRAEGIELALRKAAASGQVPKDLVVVYDDMHAFHGGTTIELRGDGTAQRTDRLKGRALRAKMAKVNQQALVELVRELVKHEAWKQKTAKRNPVPDESRAELKIKLDGEIGGFGEWYNDLQQNARLSQIKQRLDRIVPPD